MDRRAGRIVIVVWHTVARLVVDALAPRRCAACERVADHAVCASCLETVCAKRPPPLRRRRQGIAAAGFEFDDAVRAVLHRGKYRGDRAALRVLAAAALPRLRLQLPHPAAVTSVPLGRRRLRSRGYNQAEVLAEVIARELRCPLIRGLARIRDTPPQADRDEAARRQNVAGAFVWRGVGLDGAQLWLVDDVMTTGATTTAAAAALESAGAARIDVAVVAAVV